MRLYSLSQDLRVAIYRKLIKCNNIILNKKYRNEAEYDLELKFDHNCST